MTLTIDTSAPVLVTGATGYVAGWLVKRLLDAGCTVHAAVRDPENTGKRQHLDTVAADAPGRLRYFQTDLLDAGSYAEAMAGCGVVFHTASPFITHVDDPRRDLVDPARLGTRNVLEEANRTAGVRRVVVTSSCAAIYGDNADLDDTPGGVFTEDHWNTTSSLRHQPYSYSKTVAEREAWAIAEEQDRWRLVVINPSLVLGPGLNPRGTSESFSLVRQMGDGTLRWGIPDWGMGAVDVRDLADAHVRAGFLPEAHGRYLISGHDTGFPELAATLLPRFGDRFPIPRRTMPRWLLWLVGPAVNRALTRRAVARNVGLPWRGDSTRSRDELGVTYRPLAESMNDFFQQLVDHGLVTPRR